MARAARRRRLVRVPAQLAAALVAAVVVATAALVVTALPVAASGPTVAAAGVVATKPAPSGSYSTEPPPTQPPPTPSPTASPSFEPSPTASTVEPTASPANPTTPPAGPSSTPRETGGTPPYGTAPRADRRLPRGIDAAPGTPSLTGSPSPVDQVQKVTPTGADDVLAAANDSPGGHGDGIQRLAITLIVVSVLLVVLSLTLATTSLRRRLADDSPTTHLSAPAAD